MNFAHVSIKILILWKKESNILFCFEWGCHLRIFAKIGSCPYLILFLVIVFIPQIIFGSEAHSHRIESVPAPPYYSVLGFIGLLLAIAIIPISAEHWWESNKNKAIVTAIFSIPVLIYYIWIKPVEIFYHVEEYFGFITLLFSLYVISGGILLKGNIRATPKVNLIFLTIGAVIANIFGTTGASMLLIRPILKTNKERKNKKHIVIFFIFIVANMGGCLLPIGDPPLYMGYLNDVPFFWTLKLSPLWFVGNGLVLTLFYFIERRSYAKEEKRAKTIDIAHIEPIRIDGKINFLFIAGILGAIIMGLKTPERELVMIIFSLLSIHYTPKKIREDNHFNYSAIIEVAVLFLGIFITMIPALILLEQKGESLGVNKPWQFMWMTGVLSSFLDNTPTYLTFVSLGKSVANVHQIFQLVGHPVGEMILRAISIGAVFMGANTYIGNGPNFMVKAIAEQRGPLHVKMPSFFGFMKYSIMYLIPVFIIVTLIFFR